MKNNKINEQHRMRNGTVDITSAFHQCGCGSIPSQGAKVDSALHPFEVGKMSTSMLGIYKVIDEMGRASQLDICLA